jgi:hypothetical protein
MRFSITAMFSSCSGFSGESLRRSEIRPIDVPN